MGKVAEIKTKQTDAGVDSFLSTIADEQKRKDSYTLIQLMEAATGEPPKMWGASLIGFGLMRYKSPRSGREVDWFKMGFSPRKAALSIHLALDINRHAEALKKLGKHKTGVGCLYINKLEDVDTIVLKKMIEAAVK